MEEDIGEIQPKELRFMVRNPKDFTLFGITFVGRFLRVIDV